MQSTYVCSVVDETEATSQTKKKYKTSCRCFQAAVHIGQVKLKIHIGLTSVLGEWNSAGSKIWNISIFRRSA